MCARGKEGENNQEGEESESGEEKTLHQQRGPDIPVAGPCVSEGQGIKDISLEHPIPSPFVGESRSADRQCKENGHKLP